MENIKNFVVRIDGNSGTILTENFDTIIDDLYSHRAKCKFALTIIDENSIIDDKINSVVNYYLTECLKPEAECCFARGFYENAANGEKLSSFIRKFVKNVIECMDPFYLNKAFNGSEKDVYDCFSGRNRSFYFSFTLPCEFINEDKRYKYMYLGPDYLMGSLYPNEIFEYILPSFYLFLYENDGFNNEKLNKLEDYKIGLH